MSTKVLGLTTAAEENFLAALGPISSAPAATVASPAPAVAPKP